MQSQALDLRIQPLQIDSPPRPHEFAVPASSPSSRHHRASANINNTDSSNGMPNHAFGMYTGKFCLHVKFNSIATSTSVICPI